MGGGIKWVGMESCFEQLRMPTLLLYRGDSMGVVWDCDCLMKSIPIPGIRAAKERTIKIAEIRRQH